MHSTWWNGSILLYLFDSGDGERRRRRLENPPPRIDKICGFFSVLSCHRRGLQLAGWLACVACLSSSSSYSQSFFQYSWFCCHSNEPMLQFIIFPYSSFFRLASPYKCKLAAGFLRTSYRAKKLTVEVIVCNGKIMQMILQFLLLCRGRVVCF